MLKKGRRVIRCFTDQRLTVFVTRRWRLVLLEGARMFSVDENSSSFFSFLYCCHLSLERGSFYQ